MTLICCIMGMYNKNPFTFAMNVITPVVLTALGIIMLKLAECERAKESGNKGAEMPGGTLWRTRQLKNSHHL